AAIGTVGSAITGGDPLTGALIGGAAGGIGDLFGGAGGIGGLFGSGADAATPGLASAGSAAAPASEIASPVTGAIPAAGAAGAGGDISSIAGSTGATTIGAGAPSIAPAALDLSTATPGAVSVGGAGLSPASITGTSLAAPGAAGGAGAIGGGGAGGFVPSAAPALDTTGISPDILAGNAPSLTQPTDTLAGGGSFGSRALNYVSNHPGLALGGLGLGASLLMNSSVPGLDSLQTEAGLLAQKGNSAAGALQSGQLPQGAQASLDQATEAAKATMRSRFAGLGLSGSTQEAEALSGIDQQAASQKYQMLLQLTQTGLGELGQADSLYGTILNAEVAQDANASNAISRFAGALAGGAG